MADIDELHARFGRPDALVDYFRGLRDLGVVRFQSFVSDGRSEFFGADGQRVVSPPHHEVFAVAGVGDRGALLEHLRQHADGETSYAELSKALAASGVDRWVADTGGLTMTYRDRAGTALLVERVE